MLASSGPMLLDGAWGTELLDLGLPPGECADACNLFHADIVRAVADGYAAAGCRIITTNTFQANAVALTQYGLSDRVSEVNQAGVIISKLAAGDRARVFGSIGPILSGKSARAEEAFRQQAEALASAGADGLVLETMIDIDEARAAVIAARSTSLPVIASFAFTGSETLLPADAARAMAAAGADGVGANCGQGLDGFIEIVKQLRAACDLPIWCKPSPGIPGCRISPEAFAEQAMRLVDAGADMIGGCCGAGPEFIRALAARLAGR